ncbi:MAG: hypothetical protein IJ564_00660 [Alphaproteobacteria bacterium]|nr:hypothetical protein [Alphaproteobacteria bacterium]
MIVDGNNAKQRNILINKCFYQTTLRIMHFFKDKGDSDYANKTIEVISAYHSIVQKKRKNNFDADYNSAFDTIDSAIRNIANKVFYTYGSESFNMAYGSFKDYNYLQAVRGKLHQSSNK